MAEFDYKEYARQMRENVVRDNNGIVLCSPELWEQIASIIENIPTADVEEVKHGEWIYEVKYYKCSICAGKRFNLLLGTDAEYCPYCGAKMDGGKEE